MSIDSQTLNLTGSLKVTGDVKTNVSSKIGIGTDAPDAMVHVSNTHPKVHIEERDGGGTQTAVRLHANAHALNIEVGQEYAADSRANIVFSSMDGSHEHFRVVGSNSAVVMSSSLNVASNIETTNVRCNDLSLESFTLSVTQGFDDVINVNNETSNTVIFSNLVDSTTTTTGAVTVSQGGLGVASNIHANNVYAANNVFASNAYITGMPVAQLAANLVTWDSATGQIMDSGGLFSNKLAVVSQQPPSALTSNTYTDPDQGDYTVLVSSGTDDYKAFDKNASTYWLSGTGYTATSNSYAGVTALSGTTSAGEWIKLSLPTALKLRHTTLTNGINADAFPANAKIYASNDDSTWTQLTSWSGATASNTHIVNATTAYRYYALVTLQVYGNYDKVSVGSWNLFCESFSIDNGKIDLSGNVGNITATGNITTTGKVTATSARMTTFEDRNGTVAYTQTGPHDRPLVKYPEVPFLGNGVLSQNGYTASASGQFSVGYPASNAFVGYANITSAAWVSPMNTFTTTSPYNDATSANTFTWNGTTVNGPWLKLELIKPMKMSYSQIYRWHGSPLNTMIKDGYIYGSNDDSNYTRLVRLNQLGTDWDQYTGVRVFVNATDHFKYYVLQVTAVHNSDALSPYVTLGEWELYGYEEGDTSTDHTWTPVLNTPSTQHLQVYWDAGNTSSYSGSGTTVTDLSGNGVTGAITGNNGFDSEYNAWEFDGSGDYVTGTMTTTVDNWVHSISMWAYIDASDANGTLFFAGNGAQYQAIGIRQSGKDKMYYYFFTYDALFNYEAPQNQWVHLVFTYDGGTDAGATAGGYGVSRKFYVDCNEQTLSTVATGQRLDLQSTSTNFGIGARYDTGSEPFTGKIANVRVFSKKLSVEQIRELYEYDAPRFGHRQNSLSLHKGNLGVGVSDPTSRFEVAGADGLQEYPPRAIRLYDYHTYIEGHGTFNFYSSQGLGLDLTYFNSPSWNFTRVFVNDIGDNTTAWVGDLLSTAPGLYQALAVYAPAVTSGTGVRKSILKDGSSVFGEWIEMHSPYAINVTSIVTTPRSGYGKSRGIGKFVILGSNDGKNWEYAGYGAVAPHDNSSSTDAGGYGTKGSEKAAYVSTNSNGHFYTHHRLVVTHIMGHRGDTNHVDYTSATSEMVNQSYLRFFGTPAPSALEDGHLTLGKALTLPRVSGHAAGAETPRAESLLVHYDTTVDSVVSGSTVVDSGNGNHGTLTGDAAYSSTDRAFTFDGTGDYILKSSPRGLPTGDAIYSMSAWVNINSSIGTSGQVITFGSSWNSLTLASMYIKDGDQLGVDIGSNQMYTTNAVLSYNTWHHIAIAKKSTGQISTSMFDMYVDGTLITAKTVAGTGTQNLGTAVGVSVGLAFNGINDPFKGKISNPKLWDVVLTAEEVAMEYALGRTGKSINLTDTALCLGGTAPRAQLDVRGSARFQKIGISDVHADAHVPSSSGAPLSVLKNTFDGLGGGIELMRLNDPTGNYQRGSAIWHAYHSTNGRETLYFAIGGGDYGTTSYDYGRVRAYIDTNNNGGNLTFTGQHRAVVENIPLSDSLIHEGLIVSAKNNRYVKLNGITIGSNAITINESVPLVTLSNVAYDKSCFGVLSSAEDPDVREDRIGNFVTTGKKEKGDYRCFINSVGEGAMWVTDTNGPLESGDYITTSNVAGYGQKQDDDILHNYTVAKITMDCDFAPVIQPIQRIKQSNVVEIHYTAMVPVVKGVPHEFVTTTVTADDEWSNVSVSPSDVTYAEWSNLEANVQNTYTLTYTQTSNVVYDVKYTKSTTTNVGADDAWDKVYIEPSTVTYSEWSNLEANVQNTYTLTYTKTTTEERTEVDDPSLWNIVYYQMVEQEVDADYPDAVKHETVTERLENALDENGQLQWEDHPTETEKAYKIRYIDATGQQTDEANAVHRAAFVGVTYHCG